MPVQALDVIVIGLDGANPPSTIGPAGAPAAATNLASLDPSNTATARGGAGATPVVSGNGGNGGSATALVNSTSADTASAVATAVGGDGGNRGPLSFNVGGVGGTATGAARAVSTAAGTATARLTAQAGTTYNNESFFPSVGPTAVTLLDAVSGMTNGGVLVLEQIAIAGNTFGVGNAGATGTSSLSFNDLASPTRSRSLVGLAAATGGSAIASIPILGVPTGGNAVASINLAGQGDVSALSRATGGNGSAGGFATADSRASGTGQVTAISESLGGSGNRSPGSTGAGAAASAWAQTSGSGNALARTVATGGAGGDGDDDNAPVNGAAVMLVDTVAGFTQGGTLTLEQWAVGGAGGAALKVPELPGAAGGAATSTLSFDDRLSAGQSAHLVGLLRATGGNAGAAGGLNSTGSNGGAAVVTLSLFGPNLVSATGQATGGVGGLAGQGMTIFAGGSGGAATSMVHAEGSGAGLASAHSVALGGRGADAPRPGDVAARSGHGGAALSGASATSVGLGMADAVAVAHGGRPGAVGTGVAPSGMVGLAQATAMASSTQAQAAHAQALTDGAAGSQGRAQAITRWTSGGASLTRIDTVAASGGDGQTVSDAAVQFGAAAPAAGNAGPFNSFAHAVGQPEAASVAATLAANPNVRGEFTARGLQVLSAAALGGLYATGATGAQTYSASVSWTVDGLALAGPLALGWTGGTGAGFDQVSITVSVDGLFLATTSFLTLPAAQTYFTDATFDLGSFAGRVQPLEIAVTLDTTVSSAGAGYGVTLLLAGQMVPIPEPSTAVMLALGVVAVSFMRSRRPRGSLMSRSAAHGGALGNGLVPARACRDAGAGQPGHPMSWGGSTQNQRPARR